MRIATTVQSPYEPDAIYNLPKLVFLGTAEMLCGLLVFCVPAFPQAINSLGVPKLISQISLLISSRKSSQQASWASTGESWPQTKYAGGQATSYKQIDNNSLRAPNRLEDTNGSGIVHTTEFTSIEMRAPNGTRGEFQHQYPWSQNDK